MSSSVESKVDIHSSCCCRRTIRLERKVWHSLSQGIIRTVSRVRDVPRTASRDFGCISFVVVDCGESIWLVRDRADGGNVGAHPVRIGGFAYIGCYEDVCSLANAEGDDVCCVRFLEAVRMKTHNEE